MIWSDEVQNNRYQAAIARATAERKLRKRGLPVPVMETAQAGPLLAMVTVASGLVVWQHWNAPLKAALARNPLVQQFRSLIFGPGSSGPRPAVSKSGAIKGSSGTKISARKPAVVTPSPAQAAAAAAEARLAAASSPQVSPRAVPPIPSRPAQTDPQPQASTSAAGTSAAGASGGGPSSQKKKKSKKRR
ncbi:hypothetical protein Vretimale_4470 [Volvox reticuliferus]|uniref:Uncharacterized protein n=1 Tax=Volvox reticuliferus TaxID=1737510 RepID=A0A8J4C1B5_9CHLO|nr:hypothetical protein Vretifemale_3007 [Volvox reticuliferus]GIL99244.1 hypothetical protein Vretimale_4470 [Volvox reticuliferus]